MATFRYGCWVEDDGPKKRAIAMIDERDVRQFLLLAFMETKDIGKALDLLKAEALKKMKQAVQ